MTGDQRQQIREAVDTRRRATIRPKARPGRETTPVVRAAAKAHRAQDNAGGIITALVETQPTGGKPRCVFCGLPSPGRNGVCVGHADLGATR